MSDFEQRTIDAGVELPARPAPPAGGYLPAVISGNLVYTSGQLPLVDGALRATGKVGIDVTAEDAREYAKTATLNALAAVAAEIGTLDRVTKIVKVTGYVASAPSFTAQPGVIDGASDLLRTLFGDVGVHARSAIGVAVLPLDSPVEIELVVEFI